jgi:hypothetical protein
MNVELRIEELVLRGFVPGQRHRIGEVIESELSRLFTEKGVPPSLGRGGVISHLDGGALSVAPGTSAEEVGTWAAQALYRGMTG